MGVVTMLDGSSKSSLPRTHLRAGQLSQGTPRVPKIGSQCSYLICLNRKILRQVNKSLTQIIKTES